MPLHFQLSCKCDTEEIVCNKLLVSTQTSFSEKNAGVFIAFVVLAFIYLLLFIFFQITH